MVVVVALLFGGWSAFWYYASGQAQTMMDGWRDREAKAGRFYDCGSRSISGFPFRFEVACENASAQFRGDKPAFDIKLARILVAAQIYQPDLLISEFQGPLSVADPGQSASLMLNWTLGQASVRGTPISPKRVALVFDNPEIDRVLGGSQQPLLRAKHVEVHGRIAAGSAADKPAIEVALNLDDATAPSLHPAAADPIDADIVAMLRGLNDFAPKPWSARFREMQAAGGGIDITSSRVQQGDILAVGSGSLALNPDGRLQGQVRVTIAGLDKFLNAIGAQQMVQSSSTMDRLAGVLDRLAPGLGNVAREQAGANISAGINMLGEQTTLEGRHAVTLPLRFEDGSMFLGPIPIGNAPALF
jgi:hypothetical protein